MLQLPSHVSVCRIAVLGGMAFLLAMCAPEQPDTPRPTASTILEITPAPTLNLDATATHYAQQLIPTPTPAGLYVVQGGDSLSSLAAEFDTTVEELMAANGITDANALQVGQTLLIPSLLDRTFGTPPALTITADPNEPTATPTETPTATPPMSSP
jgi:LysM repeat protein